MPKLPILIHGYGYDYGDPRLDQGFNIPPLDSWLGDPMRAHGFPDGQAQRDVIRVPMDDINNRFSGLAAANGGGANVHFIDNRTVVGTEWHDELHPTDKGFAVVAAKFAAVLATI